MGKMASLLVLVIELVVLIVAVNYGLSGLWNFREDPIFSFIPTRFHPEGEWQVRIYCLIAVLLVLLHWVLRLAVRQSERSITLKTSDSQSLQLYKSAIVQYVRNTMSGIPGVVDHDATVRQVGSTGVALTIRVKLSPTESIPSIQSRIEDTIRRRLTETLGIEKIHRIQVIVKDFAPMEPGQPILQQDIPLAARSVGTLPPASPAPEPAYHEAEESEFELRPREFTLGPPKGPQPVEDFGPSEPIEIQTSDEPEEKDKPSSPF